MKSLIYNLITISFFLFFGELNFLFLAMSEYAFFNVNVRWKGNLISRIFTPLVDGVEITPNCLVDGRDARVLQLFWFELSPGIQFFPRQLAVLVVPTEEFLFVLCLLNVKTVLIVGKVHFALAQYLNFFRQFLHVLLALFNSSLLVLLFFRLRDIQILLGWCL